MFLLLHLVAHALLVLALSTTPLLSGLLTHSPYPQLGQLAERRPIRLSEDTPLPDRSYDRREDTRLSEEVLLLNRSWSSERPAAFLEPAIKRLSEAEGNHLRPRRRRRRRWELVAPEVGCFVGS